MEESSDSHTSGGRSTFWLSWLWHDANLQRAGFNFAAISCCPRTIYINRNIINL